MESKIIISFITLLRNPYHIDSFLDIMKYCKGIGNKKRTNIIQKAEKENLSFIKAAKKEIKAIKLNKKHATSS